MVEPSEVNEFWINEVGPSGWYIQDDALDDKIRTRFAETWDKVTNADCEGKSLEKWFETPKAMLGLLIVLDQFSRNMFRGDGRSFKSDKRARAVAKKAIEKGWDKRVSGPERQFFYMPLMHSECLMDQDRAIRLFKTRMDGNETQILHARVHREIIRRFGRFPYRNDALGRETTAVEAEFLENGGYRAILNELQPVAA